MDRDEGRTASTKVDSDPPVALPVRDPAHRISLGDAIGRFVVVGQAGAGGMGVVYAAYDPALDRKVALKLLRTERIVPEQTGEMHARLLREAQAMARLSHPNVITVFEAGTLDGQVFMAMEFVDGSTLGDWAGAEGRTWREILDAYCAAGRGLLAAHRVGMVHRDFKPGNVLVTRGGEVKVTDFGLVRTAGAGPDTSSVAIKPAPAEGAATAETTPLGASSLTRTGAVLGTLRYMAPEQYDPAAEIGPAADQFGFAVALYEAVYRQDPFEGESLDSRKLAVTRGMRPPPRDTQVPGWVRRALERALSPEPGARFPSMAELIDVLGSDRRRRRLRWSVAAAAGAAAALGVAVMRWPAAAADPAAACTTGDHKLAGTWDEPTRAALGARLGVLDPGYGPMAWAIIARRVGDHVGDWQQMHRDSCLATRRGDQTPELFDLRMSCLEGKREQVAALVSVVRAIDRETLPKVVGAAYALEPLAECGDVEALLGRVRPPDDPVVRARIERLRAELAVATAEYEVGRYAPGRLIAERVLGEARSLGYKPLLASALYEAGRLAGRAGDAVTAEQLLTEAAWAAEEGRDDELVARARMQMVYAIQLQGRDLERAATWGRAARAAIARIGGDLDIEARLELNLGAIAYSQGSYQDARDHFESALALWRQTLAPEHPDLGKAMHNIGTVLSDLGELDRAADMYAQAMAQYRRGLGDRHPQVGFLLMNIGALHSQRGDEEAAIREYRAALAILEPALGGDHPQTLGVRMNIANSLLHLVAIDEALAIYDDVRARQERQFGADHAAPAKTRVNRGVALRVAGRIEEALAEHRRAEAIYRRVYQEPHAELALLHIAMGDDHMDGGDPRAAHAAFEAALRNLDGQPESHWMKPYARRGVGEAELALGRAERAVQHLELAAAHLEPGSDERAHADALLAQARWHIGKDRPAALAAVRSAVLILEKQDPRSPALRRIRVWLRSHGD